MKKKLVALLTLSLSMALCVGGVALASESGMNLDAIESSLTSAFSVSEIATMIGTIIGAGVGFVLTWWGARKLVNAIISAFKSGKLHF